MVAGANVLLSGGLGDTLAIESFLSEAERSNLKTIYYACPAAKTLQTLFAALPNYQIKKHIILPTGRKVFYEKEGAEEFLQKEIPAFDFSISRFFRQRRQHTGSSFLKYKVADVAVPSVPYVVWVPRSEHSLPGRNFTQGEVKRFYSWLAEKNLLAVLLHQGKKMGYRNKQVVDMTNNTTLLESIEILKGAVGYVGVDSCLSVLAARLFPSSCWIKSINPACLDWKHIYFNDSGFAGSELTREVMEKCLIIT